MTSPRSASETPVGGDGEKTKERVALVTGSAGFIGMHLCEALLKEGWKVVGIDSLNDYYDKTLKEARHDRLSGFDAFTPILGKIEDPGRLSDIFAEHGPDTVAHLAAQAGVRYSIENPRAYVEANLIGTFELLEAARRHPPGHMLMASTSSAYGANEVPYKETMRADHQTSFYAATKKSNEAMAHSYAHLFELPITMFRFFTVYGPWGRPDMALFKFVKAMLNDDPIDVYHHGLMSRDFTFVDDLVRGVALLFDAVPMKGEPCGPEDSLSPVAPFRVVNIGNSAPVELKDFIAVIENALGRGAKINPMDMQPGDLPDTWADTALLERLTGYRPATTVEEGVNRFIGWYRQHYDV